MPTNREVDANGFLLVKACPISSFGIFKYGAGQIGLPGDPMRIVNVYRPESEVSDPEAIESFRNVPFINDHEMLSGFEGDEEATAPEEYGVSGVLTSNVYYEAPWMRGDLKIFARDVQADLASGKKDLSLGYSSTFELKPGVFDGEAYEAIQTKLRGNHIALVKDGRVTGARVLDGLCFDHLRFDVRPSDKEDNIMAKKVSKATMDNAVAQLKALLPALEQFLNEEGQEPAHQAPAATAGVEADGAGAGEPVEMTPEVAAAPAGEASSAADLPALIQNVEAVLAQIKALAPAAPAAAAPAAAPAAAADPTKEENGATTQDEGETEGLKQVGAAAVKDGENAGLVEGQGKASPGPAAGSHATADDSSIGRFYADLAAKNRLYDRVSSVVGTFDCATMDANQVAAYGVKKLNIKCADGLAFVTLDAYLNGVEAANKTTKTTVQKQVADSAAATAEIDVYLKGI